MKEELNNTLLACLAEEARSAHAAQEAIEFCRAAGLPPALPRLLVPHHATPSPGPRCPVRKTEAGHDVFPTGMLARQGPHASRGSCCGRMSGFQNHLPLA